MQLLVSRSELVLKKLITNKMRWRQNVCRFVDDFSKIIFLNQKCWIYQFLFSIIILSISLKFISVCAIGSDNCPPPPPKLLNKHSSDWWFETPWHSSDITVMQISHWRTVKKPLEPHTGRSKLTRTSGSDPMPSFAKEVNQRLAERSIELGWFLCECLV